MSYQSVKLVYHGPFDEVDVPALSASPIVRGVPVEVTAALAALLLEQPDNWAKAKTAAKEADQ